MLAFSCFHTWLLLLPAWMEVFLLGWLNYLFVTELTTLSTFSLCMEPRRTMWQAYMLQERSVQGVTNLSEGSIKFSAPLICVGTREVGVNRAYTATLMCLAGKHLRTGVSSQHQVKTATSKPTQLNVKNYGNNLKGFHLIRMLPLTKTNCINLRMALTTAKNRYIFFMSLPCRHISRTW